MKKNLLMILAISTTLAMSITGCGSSKSDATTANTNATDNSTSAESSVDTSAFKDITVEGNNHKVTVKYFEVRILSTNFNHGLH